MTYFIETALSGFWPFVGASVMLYVALFFLSNLILRIWSRFMRMLMVRKHGWPPSHLDADGDLIENNAVANQQPNQ